MIGLLKSEKIEYFCTPLRKRMQKYFLYIAALLICTSISAQTTKVKGTVKDAYTGEPLPFVNIWFPGTTVGVTTDFDGNYSLETRKQVPSCIKAEMMGYEPMESKVTIGGYTECNFSLKPLSINLQGITVKADDKRIRAFMGRVFDKKQYNNPDNHNSSQYKIYTKMELDIANVDPFLKNKLLKKNFGFVEDYMDTSAISGIPYLPIMITESNARYYKSKNPPLSREIIDASRISGIEEDYSLAQFTGHLHANVNLYDNYMDIFNIKFASPLNEHGFMYYNYYLIDSLQLDGRKTYKLRFHPKMKSAPVLDGEFTIDSTTMALRDAHLKMVKGLNVNWVRDMAIDVENQLINDSIWFNKREKLYVDFSVTMNDSSKLVSFMGHREVNYSNVILDREIPEEVLRYNTNVVIDENVLQNDPAYWEKERPYALTQKEQDIYNMVDSIKNVPLYNTLYNIVSTAIGGYYEVDKIEIGPYYKLFSFNNLEGARFQFGARTTEELSKKVRIGGYAAYGTKDRQIKGGGTLEYMFGKQPTRKLAVSYKSDALQLGAADDAFTEGNILGSLLSKGNSQRLSMVNRSNISYEHEWQDGITTILSGETNRISSSQYVEMYTPDSISIGAIHSATIGFSARLSWNEMVNRGHFDKLYLGSDYPVITADIRYGIKDIWNGSPEFLRGEIGINYDLQIPPLGDTFIKIKAGKIWGKVPYPLLKLHEGNGTYVNSPGAFACMDFYEFASDTWFQMFYEHNFKGFFLGKIPLLKKLKWREVVSFRGVMGTISDKNNGSARYIAMHTDPATGKLAPDVPVPYLLFPEGMEGVSKPYFEAGVGITNIFRMFRVDSYWRLNHKENHLGEKNTAWVINFGIEFKF